MRERGEVERVQISWELAGSFLLASANLFSKVVLEVGLRELKAMKDGERTQMLESARPGIHPRFTYEKLLPSSLNPTSLIQKMKLITTSCDGC